MARGGCGCSECTAPNEYKDFRQSKGDGPEEMPHRKKRNLKAKGKVYDHKHIYENDGWEKRYRYSWVKDKGMVLDKTKWCLVRPWVCLICGKTDRIDREYPQGGRSRWFYYA